MGGATGGWSYDGSARRGGDGAGDWSAEHGEKGCVDGSESEEK